MQYLVSLLPPLLLITMLAWLDSFSLVRKKLVLICLLWGVASTFLAARLNSLVMVTPVPGLLVAPICEEFLKALVPLVIVKMRRTGFFIDSAVYGAAAGAGFAIAENIFYLNMYPDMLIGTAILRGMGTAIMHCGAVASTTVILCWIRNNSKHVIRYYPLALLPAMTLHAFYNSLTMPPLMALPVICLGVSALLGMLFMSNEKSIGKWMETELSSEVQMLSSMRKGAFSQTKAGEYLMSVKERFSPEVFMDMYCYIQTYLEMSILSKRNMMLAEAGMELPDNNEEIKALAQEFTALRKNIGKTAIIVLSPIVKQERINWIIGSFK